MSIENSAGEKQRYDVDELTLTLLVSRQPKFIDSFFGRLQFSLKESLLFPQFPCTWFML